MSDKTKANIAAAKMLGHTGIKERGYQISVDCQRYDCGYDYFDIFTNPADCLAAVKCLGEKHDASIVCTDGGDGACWTFYHPVNGSYYGDLIENGEYEEAVGAACVAVMEGEE